MDVLLNVPSNPKGTWKYKGRAKMSLKSLSLRSSVEALYRCDLSYRCSICKTQRALLSLPAGVSLMKSCVAAIVLMVSRLCDKRGYA